MVFSLSDNFGFKRAAGPSMAPSAPKVAACSSLEKTGIAAVTKTRFAAFSADEEDWSKYDMTYYLKGAAAGGICCGITHGALTPVDVVRGNTSRPQCFSSFGSPVPAILLHLPPGLDLRERGGGCHRSKLSRELPGLLIAATVTATMERVKVKTVVVLGHVDGTTNDGGGKGKDEEEDGDDDDGNDE